MRAFLTVLALAAAVSAQAVELVPEAKTMAAPDWVKPGLRLTYYTIQSSRTDTGVTTDGFTPTKKMGATGAAGHGYVEVTIVASEPGLVAYEERLYVLPGNERTGPSTLQGIFGKTSTTPGAVGEFWIHPAALKELLKRPAGGPAKWAQIKHNTSAGERPAVHIWRKDDKSNFQWIYDLETGLALQLGKLVGRYPKGTDPGTKSVSNTNSELMGTQDLKLPWTGAAPPEWVGRVKAIDYQGQVQIVLPGQPAPPAMRLTQSFETTKVGKTWGLYKLTTRGQDGTTKTKSYISGGGSPSSLWIPPAVCARLTKGQELFSSRATGFRVFVFYVGPDRGQDICVVRWENRLQTIDYVYDRKSGGLVRVFNDDRDVKRRISFGLAGTR